MMTGDAAVNADAPIICCTAEVLANIALRDGPAADVGQVVMDEFHFYADPDRGWAWQVPILELPAGPVRPDVGHARRRHPLRGRPDPAHRPAHGGGQLGRRGPCRCSYSYATTPLHETIEELLATKQAPVYVVHFTQAAALERAQSLDEHQRVHPGREGRDRRAHRRVPLRRRVRQDAVPAASATASACTTPACCPSTAGWSSGWPRPGCSRSSAAPTRSASASTSRSARWCSPACPSTTASEIRRCSRPGSSTRSPAGRDGPASTSPAPWSCRPPSTSSRTSGPLAKAGDDPKKRARSCARSRRRASSSWGEPTFERLVAAEPEPLDLQLRRQPRHGAQRHRARRRRLRRHAPPAHRQPRGPPGPARVTSAGRSPSTGRCCAAGIVERLDEPTRRAARSGVTGRPAGSTSPSTSRCRPSPSPPSSCSTGSRRPTPSTCCRSSSPPWTTRARSSPPSSTRPGARPSPR